MKASAAPHWGLTLTKPLKPCRQQPQQLCGQGLVPLAQPKYQRHKHPEQPDEWQCEVGQQLSTCANTLTFGASGVSSAARRLESLRVGAQRLIVLQHDYRSTGVTQKMC